MEAGPVTWPANPAATAGVRSGADWLAESLRSRDQKRYADLERRYAAFRALNGLGTPDDRPAEPVTPETVPSAPANAARHGMSKSARQRKLFLLNH